MCTALPLRDGNRSKAAYSARWRIAGINPAILPARGYGVVVESVKVSVFEYVPVRSASVAPMCCVNVIVTGSLDTGAEYVFTTPRPPRASGSENVPLTRWPVAVDDGSATERLASPAVEITLADV